MRDGSESVAGMAAQQGSEWSLHSVQKLLWTRRWLIVAIAAEVFIITGLVTFLKTPLYEASARVVIERSAPKVMQGEDVVPTVWNEFEIQRFYQTQYLLIRDPALLRKALDRYGVRESLFVTLAPREAHGDADAALPDDAKLANYIRDNLKIEQVEYSNMVKVAFRHPKPEVAAAVVNAVVETYRDYFVDSGLEARKNASKLLTNAIEGATAEVRQLEVHLARMRGELKSTTIVPTAGSAEMGKGRLESLDGELTQAKARYAKAEARLNAYQMAPPAAVEEVRNSPQVTKFRDDLGAMKKEIAELEGRVGPGWPRLRELKTAVSETERNLEQEQQRIYQQALQAARSQADQERRAVDRLESLLERELRSNAQAQGETTDFEKTRQEYEQKKQALDRLLARREEVVVAAGMKDVVQKQIDVLDKAAPPETPAVPRVKLNLALGLAFGLFLGVAAAFLAEALDNKVRNGMQLTEIGRAPLLGSIPRLEAPAKPRLIFSRKKGAVAPVMSARHQDVEEAFRALRSALLLAQPGHPPRVLLVTSALPGEGKSTVAANLGRTLASFGHPTVLIDCDLRHPRLHKVFREKPVRGLTNVLATNMPVGDVLLKTQYENLCFVPGGPCPPDPATLLDADKMREISAELLKMGFEFVIVDTPPVMVFADTFSLVPAIEGAIVVARAQVTPKDALRATLEGLRKVKTPIIGLVLNGEAGEEHGGSYYRYYHYRRGYYRKAAEARAARQMAPPAANDVTGSAAQDDVRNARR